MVQPMNQHFPKIQPELFGILGNFQMHTLRHKKGNVLFLLLFGVEVVQPLKCQKKIWTPSHWLTEHGFEPDQTADEAVEVDVHVLVCVAHGDDVVELVVETEAWAGHETHDCTATTTFRGWVEAVISHMSYNIPHFFIFGVENGK